MKLPTWKETQRLVLIAALVYLFFYAVAPSIVSWLAKLILPKIREPYHLVLAAQWPRAAFLLGNIGFGYWLSVLAEKASSSRVLWFLFGVLLGANAVILFYLIVLVHSFLTRTQSDTKA